LQTEILSGYYYRHPTEAVIPSSVNRELIAGGITVTRKSVATTVYR